MRRKIQIDYGGKSLPYYKRGRKKVAAENKIRSTHKRINNYLVAIAEALATDYESAGAIINDCLARGLAERLRAVQPEPKLSENPAEW